MDVITRKKTLRLLSNGMYIVTSRNGEHYGAATVTWITQISFRPPLIMAAIRPRSNVFQCLSESRVAVIHVLTFDQQEMASKFFTPTKVISSTINGEPFTVGKTAAPVLENASAYVECRIHKILDAGGDHAAVIMEPVEAEYREPISRPLTIADSPWEYGG